MKLQLNGQRIRLRIDEAELAALRAGATLENATRLSAITWRQTLHQTDAMSATVQIAADACAIAIPRTLIDAYAARLPCRDGLAVSLQPADGPALELMLEVDVRDSIRRRGPRSA